MFYGSREHIEMRRREAAQTRRERSVTRKPAKAGSESAEQYKMRLRLKLNNAGKREQ